MKLKSDILIRFWHNIQEGVRSFYFSLELERDRCELKPAFNKQSEPTVNYSLALSQHRGLGGKAWDQTFLETYLTVSLTLRFGLLSLGLGLLHLYLSRLKQKWNLMTSQDPHFTLDSALYRKALSEVFEILIGANGMCHFRNVNKGVLAESYDWR